MNNEDENLLDIISDSSRHLQKKSVLFKELKQYCMNQLIIENSPHLQPKKLSYMMSFQTHQEISHLFSFDGQMFH